MEKFNWTEGELGVGDCFGLHAALGGTSTSGDGKPDRHIRFAVRAKHVVGVEALQLTFLPVDRLQKLFDKHPMLERTLRVQAALLDSVSGQPYAHQRRRMMEHAGFPLTEQDAAVAYADVLAEQKARSPSLPPSLPPSVRPSVLASFLSSLRTETRVQGRWNGVTTTKRIDS